MNQYDTKYVLLRTVFDGLNSKQAAIRDLADMLAEGWQGLAIGKIYKLEDIAEAHLHIENRKKGRALIKIK